jgi:hypothetical protein
MLFRELASFRAIAIEPHGETGTSNRALDRSPARPFLAGGTNLSSEARSIFPGSRPSMDLFSRSGADFSPCRTWRFVLFREWDPALPTITFVMLNPSIADETGNDPTVERCLRRAVMWGYGRLEVRNLFALVSTSPAALRTAPDPVGPGNDEAILEAARRSRLIVAAWGKDGLLHGRGKAVTDLLQGAGHRLHCLRITPRTGQPQHPLYLPYAAGPIPYPAHAFQAA